MSECANAPGCAPTNASETVDTLIAALESRGLGWSLDNTGRLIEARVWDWPHVIGRYRPNTTEPLAKMLAEAMYRRSQRGRDSRLTN